MFTKIFFMQKRSRLYFQRKKAKRLGRLFVKITAKAEQATHALDAFRYALLGLSKAAQNWTIERGPGVSEKHGLIGHDYSPAGYLQAQDRTIRGLLPTIAEFE